MSYGPAMDLDDEQVLEPDGALAGYRTPEVLAPAAFALALASLLGFGLLSGSIVLSLSTGVGPPSPTLQALAGLLGAALAAIPLLMGLEAVRHLLDDDPLWVSGLARASVLLGAVVVTLRLLHTLAYAVGENPQYAGF